MGKGCNFIDVGGVTMRKMQKFFLNVYDRYFPINSAAGFESPTIIFLTLH